MSYIRMESWNTPAISWHKPGKTTATRLSGHCTITSAGTMDLYSCILIMRTPTSTTCLLIAKSSPFDEDVTNELLRFLESLTWPTDEAYGTWPESRRVMVDMAEMVRTYFWHPDMAGSNSIKAVLPAVLNSSAELQAKYKAPLWRRSDAKLEL